MTQRIPAMATVVYEKRLIWYVKHVTRDGERTICKKKCATWPYAVAGEAREKHCAKCWETFNG